MRNDQDGLRDCIIACWACRTECQKTLYNHCLQQGGKFVEEKHIRLMTDCIQLCQTAADYMTRNSEMYTLVCLALSGVCEACAKSCEKIGGDEMLKCAEACRKCVESCRMVGDREDDVEKAATG